MKDPSVSQEKLKELDERAALDELDKLHQMQVIEPTVFSPKIHNFARHV